MLKSVLAFGVVVAVVAGQRGGARVRPLEDDDDRRRVTTTPVPILKQINKVSEDGSYTYGYENADGTYKIETKEANGEVRGKYGYYDDTGALREIEYGASRNGFRPQGTDVKRPESALAMAYDPFDDTGYYDAEKYEKPFAYDPSTAFRQSDGAGAPAPRVRAGGRRPGARRPKNQQFQQFVQQQPQPQQQPQHFVNYQNEQAQPAYQQPQQQQQHYHAPAPPPTAHYTQHYQPQAPTVPPFHQSQLFHGHPARNIDINTGSYSVQYHG